MRKIYLRVKHGEPLKSYCNLCPRITIGKDEERRESEEEKRNSKVREIKQ